MANYLKGIGDAGLRINEILPSLDARIFNFLCGHTSGIIKGEFYEFSASAIDRGVVVKSGMMQAHGYFGCTDTDTQINFIMPSTTQYIQLYAEIDLSVMPNIFEIKASSMSNSTAFSPRQDNLRSTTNGKFQLHLWQVTLTASTIMLTDKRAYISKPANAVTAEEYTSSGGIATKFGSIETTLATKAPLASPALTGTPTAPTAAQTVNNTQLATTGYVRQAISDVKNITYGTLTYSRSVSSLISNSVKRQVNFVIGVFDCNFSSSTGPAVIANIPANFRPKSDMQFEGYYKYIVSSTNQAWGGARFTIRTNGDLEYSGQVSGAENIGTASNHGFRVKFGYEIT